MGKKARIDVRPTVFVLLMLLGAFLVVVPGSTLAAQDGDYTYTTSGSPAAATITGYTGAGGVITIPSTLGGYPVVAIGDIGFFGDSLTSVIIPDGVTIIGNQSFMDCHNLASVSIPGSVTSIGDSAFSNDALTTVVIPSSVLTIGELAFQGNAHLTSITISNGVTSIGRLAFASDPSLTSVNIPSSVTSIGENAFLGCFALNTLNVDANNPNYTSIDDVMYDKAVTTLIKCANGKSGALTVPSTVTSIEDTACNACKNLTSVVFPSSLTSIGDYAFDSCIGLTSVTIPGNITSIGTDAFGFCSGLTSIRFLGLVAPTTVGADWISNDAANMEGHAYAASNFPAPGGVWNGLTMGAVIPATEDYTYTVSFGKATITGYTGAGGAITIPSTLGGYAVVAIGNYAFSNHTSLTSVIMPDGVTTVGNSAFQSCTSLTSITIPNGVTTIGKLSFWFCTSLTSVSIPNSVTSIGFGAFDYCTAMTSLTIGSGVTTIGDYAFEQCTALTSVSIPDGVTSIGNMSFFACHMTSVTIGSGVTTIGGNVFSSCHSLTSITFLGLVAPTSVGAGWVNDVAVGVLGHAYAASNFPAPGGVWNGLTMGVVIPATEDYTYTVSDGNTTITGYTGAGGAITIPSTLGGYPTVAIGDHAFNSRTSLTSVTIPNSVTSIGSYAFYQCTSLTSVTIGGGITSIDNWTFYQCTSLTSITIPNGVTSIGGSALAFCTSLTSVIIPSSVTSLGYFAFLSCTSLTSVTIGGGVTYIGNGVFYNCTYLRSIIFLGLVAPTAAGGNWISNTDAGITGHAYASSNFPAPGSVWNGLTMGAVIPVATVPGTPTNLTTTPANAQVVLAWTAPVDDGGSAITGYKLYRSATSGGTYSLIASPTALTYTDTGLTNGQTYWYKVSAVNAIGVGVNCTAASALVPQPVSPASDDSMLILVGVIAIAVVLVAVLLFMRRKKK